MQIRGDFSFGFWVDALHGLPIVVGEEGVGGQEWVQYFGDLRSNVGVLVQVFPVGVGVEFGDFCGRILEGRGKKLRQEGIELGDFKQLHWVHKPAEFLLVTNDFSGGGGTDAGKGFPLGGVTEVPGRRPGTSVTRQLYRLLQLPAKPKAVGRQQATPTSGISLSKGQE